MTTGERLTVLKQELAVVKALWESSGKHANKMLALAASAQEAWIQTREARKTQYGIYAQLLEKQDEILQRQKARAEMVLPPCTSVGKEANESS